MKKVFQWDAMIERIVTKSGRLFAFSPVIVVRLKAVLVKNGNSFAIKTAEACGYCLSNHSTLEGKFSSSFAICCVM
jgi:hypothetical protein